MKRFDIRNLSLNENWINELKKRFKSNYFAIINFLVIERYIIFDVRSERKLFDYVQQIVSHFKNVNFQNIQQQLTWTWKNLDVDLKRDISTLNVITIFIEFLIAVKNKKKIWQKFYDFTREKKRDDRDIDRRFTRQINKQNSRQSNRSNDYQSFDGVFSS